MSETATVPAAWFAVFQHDTLPGHPANPDTDQVIDWPVINGKTAMPMSGKFLVRGPDGSLTAHEDGFLLVGEDGHPFWQPAV